MEEEESQTSTGSIDGRCFSQLPAPAYPQPTSNARTEVREEGRNLDLSRE
jgi:hypothetical protein